MHTVGTRPENGIDSTHSLLGTGGGIERRLAESDNGCCGRSGRDSGFSEALPHFAGRLIDFL